MSQFDASDLIDGMLLEHGEYDPVKAREYYLKNRVLKGRQKKAEEEAAKRQAGGRPGPTVRKQVTGAAGAAAKRKAQIARLNAKLDRLEKVLAQLVKAAKARSGVKTPDPKAAAKDAHGKNATSDKPLTAKQKLDAAKRAKENYEKNKKSKPEGVAELRKKIAEVQAKIRKARADLKAATAKDHH